MNQEPFHHHELLHTIGSLLRGGRAVAVLRCSFRHYQRVAAAFSPQAAEALITEGGHRLQRCCPQGASVVRLQHAELAVVIPNPGDAQAALAIANTCAEACDIHLAKQHPPLLLKVAIGVAVAFPNDAKDPNELLGEAALARDQALRRVGSLAVLAEALSREAIRADYLLEADLLQAIAQRRLTAYFQPIVQLHDRLPVGFECLARWIKADGSVTSPDRFMAQAQAEGFTAAIDLQVIEACLRAAAQLARSASGQSLVLSANVSAQLLEDAQQCSRLIALIQAWPLPAGTRLQLELLEESFKDAGPNLDGFLATLRELNVAIAIDDFGTGYSSLSRLHQLPIHTLKVDRSFVRRINEPHKPSNHLLRMLATISQDLGIDTTAEGVETEEQRRWLQRHGYRHAQGFLFSKPMPLEGAAAYLRKQFLTRQTIGIEGQDQ